MLPLVIDEQQVLTFKFWFRDQIQSGMYFQNELFCQIGVVDLSQRSQVYQYASKLAQRGVTLVLTCSKNQCRIWGSLRDETVKQLLVNPDPSSLACLTPNRALDNTLCEPEL